MSTRMAKDDSQFHQHRYASSVEFERGLLANLVAKRCALIDDLSSRELIWFIQWLSHQEGGIAALAKELIAKYPERIQSERMLAAKLKPEAICKAGQVREIRKDLPLKLSKPFLMKGEKSADDGLLDALAYEEHDCVNEILEKSGELDKQRPEVLPAKNFFSVCLAAANENLERAIKDLCLDPSNFGLCSPWYFAGLIETLREYKADFEAKKIGSVVVTSLGRIIYDSLDYTAYNGGSKCRLTLLQGDPRTGKSFAARAWSEQSPGRARFIEVPPGNDETIFFRSLARGLGLGNFLRYKTVDVRDRVESVLLGGDIMLVLDEAQRLWPQMNLRYGFPKRIVWIMAMANAGVPIAMIATPQFTELQKAIEKTGWHTGQLTGRIRHFESLPTELTRQDLTAVAKSVLPEAGAEVLKALAIYAQNSARYLAAIDSIATRARYLASRAGRLEATAEDVRKAMTESVIPADTKLKTALAATRTAKRPRRLPVEAAAPDAGETILPPSRIAHREDLDRLAASLPAPQRGNLKGVLQAA
jgi:hypothetical protein